MKSIKVIITLFGIVFIVGCWGESSPEYRRARIKYDLDFKRELVGDAELYLSVEASSTPGVQIVIPLNVANPPRLHGYLDLPFDLQQNDSIQFTLLDDDKLTEEQEKLVINAAKDAGYLIYYKGSLLSALREKVLPRKVGATIEDLMESVAKAIIVECNKHPFDDYGNAHYVVDKNFPNSDRDVNELSVAEDIFGLKVQRLMVKVFYP